MVTFHRTCGIITARSRSRSIQDKNVRELMGKPLMAYAIRAAKHSKLERVIVSTDSDRYAEIAKQYGAEVPFMRPPELAEDVPSEDVIHYTVKELNETLHWGIDVVVTIQPTTPLITPDDINACLDLLHYTHSVPYDSAMTVRLANEHPEWMFYKTFPQATDRGDNLHPVLKRYEGGGIQGDAGIRQTLPTLYYPTGACYATRVKFLMEHKRLIGDLCAPVAMPKLRSFDIDDEADWMLLEALMKYSVEMANQMNQMMLWESDP